MKPIRSPRRLVILLVATFSLTVTLFLGSRVVSQIQARRIQGEATSLTQNALAATETLARLRAALTRERDLLESVASAPSPRRDLQALQRDLGDVRRVIAKETAEYASLPLYPGEAAPLETIQSGVRETNASIDDALGALSEGDRHGASEEIRARALPTIRSTDEGAKHAAALNRGMSRGAVERISSIAGAWGMGLDVASVFLVLATVYLVIRVVRRYLWLMNERAAELEHFAGRVAHDVRSPLSTVSFALELAKGSPALDSRTQSSLERGIRTLQRVGQLVDGLLVFAMSGKPKVEAQGANMRAVLDGVVEDMQPHAKAKEIALDYEPPDPSAMVACNPGVLVSMASNLLSNAIKYMGDAPTKHVSLRVRELGRSVRVEVSDTGPGIPAEVRARLFQPHVRGADSTIPGLGLGLATVRRLAEAHGGSVGVKPKAAELGSLFWFELPKHVEPVRLLSVGRAPTPQKLPGNVGNSVGAEGFEPPTSTV